jgi:pimeloyl-ACP methyl ester carboxylesterase
MADIAYRTVDVDGFKVFYREAGASDAPALVLLHGFPSASHMFRQRGRQGNDIPPGIPRAPLQTGLFSILRYNCDIASRAVA